MRLHNSRHTGSLPALTALLALTFSSLIQAELGIQIGAYRQPVNAELAAQRVAAAGFTTLQVLPPLDGETLTRVIVGHFTDQTQADAARIRLAALGWKGYVREYHLPATAAVAAGPSPGIETADAHPATDIAAATRGTEATRRTPHTPAAAGTAFAGWQGFYQSEFAYTYPRTAHWSKLRQLFELGSGGSLTPALQWKLNARLAYDPLYDNSNSRFYPQAVRDDQDFHASVREAYLDYSAGDWDFRFGRQHIIWGEMVGLFFADVVSAKDLRQFVAQDFDLLRIPQWAIRSEYFHGKSHAELVWIPYMSYDEIGKPGADFYPYPPPPPPGYGIAIADEKIPSRNLSNSAYGARYSYLTAGWDLSAFYYRSEDASPTFFREVVSSPIPLLRYQPEHDKIHQYGLTVAKEMDLGVLKAEAVYTRDRWFNVTRLSDADGVVRQDQLDYIVGLEHVTERGAHLNVQFFQRWFPDHDPDMIPDKTESGVSFFASTKIFDGQLEPEVLWIQSLNRNDGMVRPRLTWHVDGHWRLAVGFDLFHGPDTGLFGQFDRNDRVVGEARYAF